MTDSEITSVDLFGWEIPTEEPESDGTLQWDSTTIIVAEISAGSVAGLGWTYGDRSVATLIETVLATEIIGRDALSPGAIWRAMLERLRNIGKPGIGAMAVSAMDLAVWDLKARLLDLPLVDLLGRRRDEVPVYGSGGFTSYDLARLQGQLSSWAEAGMSWVKMKVGREPEADISRVAAARKSIGDEVGLMVDANGAYGHRHAIGLAQHFHERGVVWYEEPVSSDDRAGLRFVREHLPTAMEVTAGEYAYRIHDFRDLLDDRCVDVLQGDVTRCGGITGLLQAAELAEIHHVPFSTHTAPQAHLHVAGAIEGLRHLEWFHDHVRVEEMLFDGCRQPEKGALHLPEGSAGNGLSLRRTELADFRIL